MAEYSNGLKDNWDIPQSSVSVLEARYLIKNDSGEIIETGEDMLRRVARDLAIAEAPPEFKNKMTSDMSSQEMYEIVKDCEEVKKWEKEFFEIMSRGYFLPNSPTLMNAGRKLQQLSACFVLPIEDSVEEIFETQKNMALVHKSGGGTGFSFSRLRPNGAYISSTSGYSPGPLSFIFGFNENAGQITQGGKRRGANMGIIRANHPDSLCWARAKEEEGVLKNFNLSIAFSDSEIEAVKNDTYILMEDPRVGKEYTVENAKKRAKEIFFGKNEKFKTAWELSEDEKLIIDVYSGEEIGKVEDNKLYFRARSLFDVIIEGAWKKGEPGIIFIERMNQANPTPEVGEIESTNPCVIGSTLISTEKGLMRMDNITKEYKEGGIKIATDCRVPIKIKDNKGNISLMQTAQEGVFFNKISRAFCTGIKEIYKVITKSGYELLATADHKLLTNKFEWLKLENLKQGDKICIQSGAGRFNTDSRIPFKVENKYKGGNGRTYELNLPDKWSLELGQILGILVGDGWLRDKDKNCRVGFTFGGDDLELLKRFKLIINNFYGKDIKEVKRNNGVWHLSYHSKYFIDFFKKLGIKAVKSKNKRIPESIYTATQEAVVGFLQGLFTADGTIGRQYKEIRLTSSSEFLLKDVQLLLLNLGIKSKIYSRKYSNSGNFGYTNKKGINKEYISEGNYFELIIDGTGRRVFLEKIGFLNQKQDKLIQSVNFCKKMVFEDEIVSIKLSGKEKVYDLTEPKTLTFITNGLVSLDCGEQPLLSYESCNLGGINLSKIVNSNGELDKILFDKIIRSATRFLDNVIDRNKYALEKVDEMTKANRKIGLGVMGFAHMLIKMKVSYNSPEAVEIAERVMKFINDVSKDESRRLAEEKGAFLNFERSIYKNEKPIRNSTTTTIAPTGTIGVIASSSQGIEPIFKLITLRNVKDTIGKDLVETDRAFKEYLQEKGLYNEEVMRRMEKEGLGFEDIKEFEGFKEEIKELFVTAHDIPAEQHLKIQAAFQKYTDNAVSKTINMPTEATKEDIAKAYLMAYDLGCKGLTVYRDKSREFELLTSVDKNRVEKDVEKDGEKKVGKEVGEDFMKIKLRGRYLKSVQGIQGVTYELATGCGPLFVTVNYDEDGPLELFANMNPPGGCAAAQTATAGILGSFNLHRGESPKRIAKHLRATRCPENNELLGKSSCSQAIAKALDLFERDFEEIKKGYYGPFFKENKSNNIGGNPPPKVIRKGLLVDKTCPECKGVLDFGGGCKGGLCTQCGWSNC